MTGFSVIKMSAFCLLLAGCSILPSQGPNAFSSLGSSESDTDGEGHLVVDLSTAAASRLNDSPTSAGARRAFDFPNTKPLLRLGVGDVIGVTIYEAAGGGLFLPGDGNRAGNFVTIPNQTVARDGTISIPYAGQVRVADQTIEAVQNGIVARLKNRAIDPQVVVTLQESRANLISVTGEVNVSTQYALTRAGDRILDAVARAGGPKWPSYETQVTIQRGSLTRSGYLGAIVADPASNVLLHPGDTIILSRETRSFMALGASGQNGQISFDRESLTLAQALGRSGGVLDNRGDPGQVFVYRYEPLQRARLFGYAGPETSGDPVPVIYHANMREPQGLFMASKFHMRDNDILYVSNTASIEVAKLLNLLNLGAFSVQDVASARVALKGQRP